MKPDEKRYKNKQLGLTMKNSIPQGGDYMADMLAVGSTGTGMSRNALLINQMLLPSNLKWKLRKRQQFRHGKKQN